MYLNAIQNYSTKDKSMNGNLKICDTPYPYYTENNFIHTKTMEPTENNT